MNRRNRYLHKTAIILAITVTSVFILNTNFSTPFEVQEAYAHIDPDGDATTGEITDCNSIGVALSLTVFRSNVALSAGASLIAGETVEYGVTLTDPTDVGLNINCAQDDGAIMITKPLGAAVTVDGVGDTVAPIRPIPCMGGSNTVGDTIGPADCSVAVTSFVSNRVSYLVDCRQTIGGQLRASAEYDGLAHNNANDANAAQVSGSTEIANPCAKTIPGLVTQSNPSSSGLAPGTSVNDKATVTGAVGLQPTGNVTFFLCNPGQLTGGSCPSGGTQIGGLTALVNGMATSSNAAGATTTPNGKYCWRAQYLGDANYNPLNHTNSLISGNGGECFNIGQVPPGTIIIKKDTVPNDAQDFSFTHNITSNPAVPSPFKLDDDSNPTLSNTKTFNQVPAGSYRVTEAIVPSIPLLSIICTDPSGDSGRSGNSADIDLDGGETVTCTFINGIQEAPCENGIISVPQPEDAISMTTIRSGNIVKTIHAEKQIFDCELSPDGIPVIADVTIIAEIYENISTKEIISKQVEVVTCIKEESRGRVFECDLSIPSVDRIPVTNCTELPIEHPQEMNTVRKGATAKTIETQKEVFICTFADGPDSPTTPDPNDKKVDLVLFTDIFQNLNTLTSEDPQILSMKCVIKIDNVTVESCRFTNHPL